MHRHGGFTLIELSVVMAIIAMVLAMAVGAHHAWRSASALDAAWLRAESCLALARQRAVAAGRPAYFLYGNGEFPRSDDSPDCVSPSYLFLRSSVLTSSEGWCCVLDATNAVGVADDPGLLPDFLEGPDLPMVGAPAFFEKSIRWWDGDDEQFLEWNAFVFWPDGSADILYEWPGATLTNILCGAGIQAGETAERRRTHSRAFVLDRISGLARAVPPSSDVSAP